MRHLMKDSRWVGPSLVVGLAFTLCSGTRLAAQTINDFEGGGTPVTLEQFQEAPGPTIVSGAGGNPGGYLQLTEDLTSLHNFATFDTTDFIFDTDGFATSTFSFDFNITSAAASADGFSFSFLDTTIHGLAGGITAPPFTAEDPVAPGVLGFGFDTYSNGGAWDGVVAPATDYNEISVFWWEAGRDGP